MRIRKALIAVLALAIAIAFSPLTELQAATFVSPDTTSGLLAPVAVFPSGDEVTV